MTIDGLFAGDNSSAQPIETTEVAQQPGNDKSLGEVSHWAGEDAGYADTKGFKSAADALKHAQRLEAQIGEGALFLPKDDAEKEAFYDKLGRPPTPADYDFGLPEGADTKLGTAIAPSLHKLGITAEQAKGLGPVYAELQAGEVARQEQAFLAQRKQDVAALQADMGKGYDVLTQTAKIGMESFGLADGDVYALEQSMGTRKALEFLAKIGDKVKEAPIQRVDGASSEGISKEAAKFQLNKLRNSPENLKIYADPKAPGHQKLKDQIRNLQAIVYGED
jgi:hypothetical protein